MITWLRILKWELRMVLGSQSRTCKFFFQFFERRAYRRVYEPNPEIIIEAFGGSANSFAVFAFRAAQENEVRVAHHLHVTGQIKWAVKKGIPVVVIVRDPIDAISSLMSRNYYPSAKWGFRHYTLFYEDIIQHADSIVWVHFEDLVKKPEMMIHAVNARFNTSYKVSENMAKAATTILSQKKAANVVAVPSKEREDGKIISRKRVELEAKNPWAFRAISVYRQIVEEEMYTDRYSLVA